MSNNKINSLILDMDGVLWRADNAIGDLRNTFQQISDKGLRVAFATNNATRTAAQHVQKLETFGVQAKEGQIFTSSRTTAAHLKDLYPHGGSVYVIGEEGLLTSLEESGFEHNSSSSPLAVVVGLDHGINYDKLSEATLLIRDGVKFIGTNPDRTFPTPKGLSPGAGALIAAIEAATDKKATIIGKPQPTMFKLALTELGTNPGETLVVGDRLETDIAGGQAANCRTALVLSGVTDRKTAETWQPAPEYIADDLESLIAQL